MAASSTAPHATLPECPNCAASERAVADLHAGVWHCFNCRANGTITIEVTDAPEPRS